MQGQPSVSLDGPEKDWSAYLQKAYYIDQSAITGDPRIDRTTQFLIEALEQSAKTMGQSLPPEMRANVFGIAIHHDFGRRVQQLDLPGIGQKGVEQSWSVKELADYGIAGSIRTDVYLKDRLGRPLAIYDVKTGNARLTPRRIQELRGAVGAGNIPVIELRYGDLTALQR